LPKQILTEVVRLRKSSDRELAQQVLSELRWDSVRNALEFEDRFRDTLSRKKFHRNDVEAGRRYVEAYVALLEYLEHLPARELR